MTSSQDLIAWDGNSPYHSYNPQKDSESGTDYYPLLVILKKER